EGSTQVHQDQYFAHNRRLYEAGKWEEAYSLAYDTTQALSSNAQASREFLGKLRGFAQETAFQAAFAHDKLKKDAGERQKARDWYGKAVQATSDSLVTLKAWHNLLLTFVVPADSRTFSDKYAEFESSGIAARLPAGNHEAAALLTAIYLKASEAWDSL